MKEKEIYRYLVVCFAMFALMVPQICSAADMEVSPRIAISEQLRHEWNPWLEYNSVDDEFFVVWRTSGVMREDCDPSDDYECVKSFQSIDGARISPEGEILGKPVISPPEGPDENVSWKMMPRQVHNEFRNEYLMAFYMCEDVCAMCHTRDAEGEPDTVNVATCLQCHPQLDPLGPACNLVDFHVDGNLVSPDGTIQSACDDCHMNCEDPPADPPSNHPFSCMECHPLDKEDGENPVHYRAGHTAFGNTLYTVRLDSAGNTLTQPKKVYDPPQSSAHPVMVFSTVKRQYMLATNERYFTQHYDNIVFIVDEDGNVIKGPIFFGEGSGSGSWTHLLYCGAYNSIDDTCLMPYEDFRHAPGAWGAGPNDIHGTLLDSEGNTLANIPIMEDEAEGEYEAWYPGAAYNLDRNEFLAAWFDERPHLEDGGLVGRIINADGTLKPDNVLVDTTGGQGDVAIVYAPKHKMYLIVYKSTENFVRSPDDPAWYHENDIYAMWVDGETGLPVGDKIPIYIGEGDQAAPQVSYSPVSDKFLIVWWDTHAPNDYEPVPGETGQYGEISSVVMGLLGRGNVYGVIYGAPNPCAAKEIYGEHSEEVELLRDFRDEMLSQSPVGQEIIELYYQWSPVIVKAMERDEKFKGEIKKIIEGILPLIR